MTVRILHITVQPVLVNDDGSELTPGPEVCPASVTLSGLAEYLDDLRREVRLRNETAAGHEASSRTSNAVEESTRPEESVT
jgi:hypothetical protein